MRARWWLALFLTASGCFQDDASTQTPCRPACREGFTCVFGTCVSICNPPCGAGSRCVSLDPDRGVCVSEGGDAGSSTGDVGAAVDAVVAADTPAPDVPALLDVPPGEDGGVSDDLPGMTDVPVAQDVLSATDVTDAGVVATDRPGIDALVDVPVDAGPRDAATAVDARDVVTATDRGFTDVVYRDVQLPDAGTCGRPGELCCAGVGCFAGALCQGDRCVGYPLEADECFSNLDCPSGTVCAGGRSCGTNPNWRWCYRCQAVPGVARFGEACRSYTECATGACSFGRCSYACDLSSVGDGQCAGLGVRSGTCTQITYGLPPIADGGVPRAWQLQGVCELGCARNRDCASGTACIPLSDDLLDRVVFICASTRATAAAGTPCMFGDDCQSGMCIGGANPMGGAACSAPCVDDSDCPTAAPVCTSIRLYTSRGTISPTRGCLPRRS
jgi:hypothetical protein